MRVLVIIIIIITSSVISNAIQEDKVVAIVNKHSITLHQLLQKEELLSFFAKKRNIKIDKAKLHEQSLNDIILEHLVIEDGRKYNIDYSDNEISQVIDNVAEAYKIKKDVLSKELEQNNILQEALKNFAIFNIIRDKLVYKVISDDVIVHENEVYDIVMEKNVKDFWVNCRIVYSDDLSNKNYERIIKLQKKLDPNIDIKKVKLKQNIYINEVSDYLSNLPKHLQLLVNNLKNSKKSDVINNGEQLIFITVSDISIEKLNAKESKYITNFLGEKKLINKIGKYILDLHKNAYIKTLI